MRILVDEQASVHLAHMLKAVAPPSCDVKHVQDMKWKGTKDVDLYDKAKRAGFDALITNDRGQLADPQEQRAIVKSRMHHVLFPSLGKGLAGQALTSGAVVAALPSLMKLLDEAEGQLLITIKGLSGASKDRLEVRDLRTDPLPYTGRTRRSRGRKAAGGVRV